jgi:hypothetical protein
MDLGLEHLYLGCDQNLVATWKVVFENWIAFYKPQNTLTTKLVFTIIIFNTP